MAVLRNNAGNIEVLNMDRSLLDQDKNLTAATKKDLKNLGEEIKDKKLEYSIPKEPGKTQADVMPSGFFYRNSRASQWAGMNGMYAIDRKDEKGKKPFAQFEHKMWGIRAMFKVLQGSGYFQLIDGEIRNEKMKQSVNVFNKYAPSTENSVSDYNGRVTGMMKGKLFTGLNKEGKEEKYLSDQKIAKQYNITMPDGFDENNIRPQDIPNFTKAMVVMENSTETFINDAGKKERFVDYYLGDEEAFKMAEWAAQRDYSEDETYASVKAGYEHYLKNKDLLVHELGD